VKASIKEIDNPLMQLMQLKPDTEFIDHGRGQESEIKVVDKEEVDYILQSGQSNQNEGNESMQYIIDELEFFKVEPSESRGESFTTQQVE